jgi:hypothetical protein
MRESRRSQPEPEFPHPTGPAAPPTARGVAAIPQLTRSSLVNSYAAPAQDRMQS